MVYIRKKTITNKKTGKTYTYAYAVKNTWRKRGARQKVLAYMGKVHTYPKKHSFSFFEHQGLLHEEARSHFLATSNANTLIRTVIEWELDRHEIPPKFTINFSTPKVAQDHKPATLELNKGLLSSYTLRKLIRFRRSIDERETMYALAKSFVEAGLDVPQQVIISFFNKIYK